MRGLLHCSKDVIRSLSRQYSNQILSHIYLYTGHKEANLFYEDIWMGQYICHTIKAYQSHVLEYTDFELTFKCTVIVDYNTEETFDCHKHLFKCTKLNIF